MTALELAHQVQEVFDVAGPDIDDQIVARENVLLQVCEVPAAQRVGLLLVSVGRFHRHDFGASHTWCEQVPRDRGLADVAAEIDGRELHSLLPFFLNSGLVFCWSK